MHRTTFPLASFFALSLVACGPAQTTVVPSSTDAGDAGADAASGDAAPNDGGPSTPTPWVVTPSASGYVTKVAALDDGVVLATNAPTDGVPLAVERRSAKDGAPRWSTPITGSGATTIVALAADEASGDTTVLVLFGGDVKVGGVSFTRSGPQGGWAVLRFAGADGKLVWGTGLNTSSAAVAAFTESVAVTKEGDVVLAGTAALAQTWGKESVVDGFVLRLRGSDGAVSGAASFAKTPSTFYPPYPAAVAIDGAGTTWVTGRFTGSVAFGKDTLVAAGASDGFVARLDATMSPTSALAIASVANDEATKLAADRAGHVWVRGALGSNGTVGSQPFAGGAWLACFGEDGTIAWVKPVSALGSSPGAAVPTAVAGGPLDLAFGAGAGVAIEGSGSTLRTYVPVQGATILGVGGAAKGHYVGGYVDADANVDLGGASFAVKGPSPIVAYVP